MKNGDYKVKIENRLTILETKLNEILENHLPHLDTKIDRIQWLLITTLTSLLVGIALKVFQ